MEQDIRFCTTSDDVRIAYATVGQGTPIVLVYSWVTHLEVEWQHPDPRAFLEGLARRHLLVRYDKRGTGLSDREIDDFSIEARLRDLEAVVDRLELEKFVLIGESESGPTAITYAVRHPDRVSHLILYASFHRSPHPREAVEPLLKLIRSQWGMGSAALASVFVPSGDPSRTAFFIDLQRAGASAKVAAGIFESNIGLDVTPLARELQTPTLVLHRRGDQVVPFQSAREMASLIPDCRFQPLEGDIHPPYWGDREAILKAIAEFLGDHYEDVAGEPTPSELVTILFADIVGSTALTEEMGDTAFREKARELDEALRKIIRDADGTPVEGKLLGDGVLSVFTSAKNAIEAALRFGAAGESVGLGLHLGIHAGDVIREGDNVFGGAVNIAARISGESEAGEVLVSDTVRGLARTSAGVSFEDRGERELKGVGEPVQVWAVREQTDGD